MNHNIISSAHGPVILESALPSGYNGPILPGAVIHSAVKEFGTIIFQEIKTEEFLIRYNFFHFLQKLTLTQKEDTQHLQSLLALKNDLRHKIKSLGLGPLRQGQFSAFYSPRTEIKTLFSKEKEYNIFHAFYSMPLLEDLATTFPFLVNPVAEAKRQNPFIVADHKWASPQMHEIVNNILICP